MFQLTTTIQRPCWNMLKLPELSWSSFTTGLHDDGDRRWTCRCLLELTRRPQLIDSFRSFHLIGYGLRMFADKLCTTHGTQSRPFSLLPKATMTPGDSWRNTFLEDFIKFLCETSPWYAYCNPLPNIAAPEGNECGQRPLPACMASRKSICIKADRQILWKTFQSPHQSEDVLCPLQNDLFVRTAPDRGHSATYACTRVAQHECTRSMPSARSHVQSSKRPISNMPHSSSRSSRWHWMSKKLTRTCLRSAARFDMRPLKASLRLSCGGDTFPSLALLRDLTFCRHITWCKKMRVAEHISCRESFAFDVFPLTFNMD